MSGPPPPWVSDLFDGIEEAAPPVVYEPDSYLELLPSICSLAASYVAISFDFLLPTLDILNID